MQRAPAAQQLLSPSHLLTCTFPAANLLCPSLPTLATDTTADFSSHSPHSSTSTSYPDQLLQHRTDITFASDPLPQPLPTFSNNRSKNRSPATSYPNTFAPYAFGPNLCGLHASSGLHACINVHGFPGCRGFAASALPDSSTVVSSTVVSSTVDSSTVPAGVEEVLKAEHAAELAAIAAAKAESYTTTSWFIDALDYVHTSTGWPWWAAIAAVNITVRLCTFPVMVFVQKSSVKAMALSQEMRRLKTLQEAATKASTLKEYEILQKRFVDESQKVMSKHGNSLKLTLLSPLLTIVNGVVFVSFFSALSNLTNEKVPSMTHEGLLWFSDLTLPDPYFGLPVICCLATLAMVELGAVQQEMMMQGNAAQMMKWVMRGLSLLFLPAGKYVASAVGIMWVSNSMVAIAQSRVLANPAMRAKLGLPEASKMREAMQGSLAQLRQGTATTQAVEQAAQNVVSAKPPAPGSPPSAVGHKPQLYNYRPPKKKKA